jgi:hypothetical protein
MRINAGMTFVSLTNVGSLIPSDQILTIKDSSSGSTSSRTRTAMRGCVSWILRRICKNRKESSLVASVPSFGWHPLIVVLCAPPSQILNIKDVTDSSGVITSPHAHASR